MFKLFDLKKINLYKIGKHLFKTLLLILFFCICLNKTFAQTADLQGKWVVDSIVISKIYEEKVVTYTSTPKKQLKSFAAQPVSIVISADSLAVNYAENGTERGEYQIKDNQLYIKMDAAPLVYKYTKLTADRLKFEQTVTFWIDGVDAVIEEYTIYLHLQK